MIFEDLTPDQLQSHRAYKGHETVRRFTLAGSVIAFVAIHNTNLGPALGGCRFRHYESEADAIHDVLRLSRGMTYKNAMAGLPLGGGKAVIMGDPKTVKTPELMAEMGRAVETLEGRYITAEDSGTNEADMAAIDQNTNYVTGLPEALLREYGSGTIGGDPSPFTAIGIYNGIKAAAHVKYGHKKLDGLKIAIQGLGAVGSALCAHLHKEGAILVACDVDPEAAARTKAAFPDVEIVDADAIYSVDADIFSPNAMGAVLNDQTIPQLKVDIVAGGANNQLAVPDVHDAMLTDRGILYVPDYVINPGGVICVGYEYFEKSGHNPYGFEMSKDAMVAHVENIGGFVADMLQYAQDHSLTPGAAADRLAEEKFLTPDAHSEKKSGLNA